MTRQDGSGENSLVADLVPRGAQALDVAQLRAYLQQKLPPYMIPSLLVALDTFPLTANGKVDRQALPDPARLSAWTSVRDTAPRNHVEQRLADIWASVLGLKQVGIHDSFFDLGGHSLMAIALLKRIEVELGKSIPLSALFQAQTVAEMAHVIQTPVPTAGKAPCLVTIQAGKPGSSPLFLVHSLTGELIYWQALVEHLGPDLPIYGLRLPVKDGALQPFSDLRLLAAHHAEQMIACNPDGPYRLAGFSSGARVALEIAQQLVSLGREIAFLGVIDSGPFLGEDLLGESPLVKPQEYIRNVYYWIVDDLVYAQPRELLVRIKTRIKRLATGLGILKPSARPEDVLELEALHHLNELPSYYRNVFETSHQAWTTYVPHPYPKRVTLFRARAGKLFHIREHDLGWSRIAQGGIEVRVVRGDHMSIITHLHVRSLAEQFRECLEKTAGPYGSSPDSTGRREGLEGGEPIAP